jgi:uncharacterized membrane protein
VWPAEAVAALNDATARAIAIAGERDIDQDAHFGIRQLTDIALRALSPGINDPTTAATCIGYLRTTLARLAGRALPSRVQRPEGGGEPLIVRRREFAEYLDTFAEIGRYAKGDGRIVRDLLHAAEAIAAAAVAANAEARALETLSVAQAIAEQALDEVRSARDRGLVMAALERAEQAVMSAPPELRR